MTDEPIEPAPKVLSRPTPHSAGPEGVEAYSVGGGSGPLPTHFGCAERADLALDGRRAASRRESPLALFARMTLEIERKFLVTSLPEDFTTHPHCHLRQGYIASTEEGIEVRVRAADGYFTLTIKSAGGQVRTEVEVQLSTQDFEALWTLTGSRRVEKYRTRYPLGGPVAEVDIFEGSLRPLQLAEIEFSNVDAAEAFRPPDWFGQDVTANPRYKNKSLALYGLQ